MLARFSPNYDLKDLQSILSSNNGKTNEFLNKFKNLTNFQNIIFRRYGRTCLFELIKALDIKKKEIIIPAYTCVVVAHAIIKSGNIPVFLDNKKNSFHPEISDYLKKITKKTAMIIPTHLFGIFQNFEELKKKVKKINPKIFVLLDCAHSFLPEKKYHKYVGLDSDGVLFGLNISKLINSYKGGILLLNDKPLYFKMKKRISKNNELISNLLIKLEFLLVYLIFKPNLYSLFYFLISNFSFFKKKISYYDPNKIDLPDDYYKQTNDFISSLGLNSLNKYSKRIKNRRKIALLYFKFLDKKIIKPNFIKYNTWSHFPILVCESKRDLIKEKVLKKFDIELGTTVEYSIPHLPCYNKNNKYDKEFLQSLSTSKRILNLPLNFYEIKKIDDRNVKEISVKLCELINNECQNLKNLE